MTLVPQTIVHYMNASDYELTGSDLTRYITYRVRFDVFLTVRHIIDFFKLPT